LVFHSSTIAMMHGPINIRSELEVYIHYAQRSVLNYFLSLSSYLTQNTVFLC